MVFSIFDVIKNIQVFYQPNIKCLVNITFYKPFTFINGSSLYIIFIKCMYLCKYIIHMHGYFSCAFLISSAKTWIIMSLLIDKCNIVGFTDCYQPQVKTIYQLNQESLLVMKNLLES